MHMADALLTPAVAGTMYVCSTVAAGHSFKKIKLQEEPAKIPMMGVMGAFVFAAQMINFTIPGTGSSGHLAGGMLISAIVGPYAGFITMIGVLLIQCLLFADGGILALGCNIWNMAFYGCFIGSFFIWKWIMKNGITRKRIWIASITGSVLTLQLGAFSVVLETTASKITELPFTVFLLAMQPIHLVIGLVEGMITAAVLTFIYEARPELLWMGNQIPVQKQGKLSYVKTVGILLTITAITAGIISSFASAFPDGLEWSILKLTGDTELSKSGTVHEFANHLQQTTAVLPDYSLKSQETAMGTSFSGLLGSVLVLIICVLVCKGIRYMKREKKHERV